MTLKSLRDKTVTLLCEHPFFSDCKILAEYPGTARNSPLTQPLLVVGIDRIELTAGAMGSYFGEHKGTVPTGAYGEITLRFELSSSQSTAFPTDIAEGLFDCLFAPLGASKLWSEAIKHDTGAMANRQRFFLTITALLCSHNEIEDNTSVSNIIIRKV